MPKLARQHITLAKFTKIIEKNFEYILKLRF